MNLSLRKLLTYSLILTLLLFVNQKNTFSYNKSFENFDNTENIIKTSESDYYSKRREKLMDKMNGGMAIFKNYTSDITRVIPVNGKFTSLQKEIYEAVLKMENAMIKHMKPGNKWHDCLKKAENVAKEELFRLGLITDKETSWQHYLYYYPYCAHPLGLDVHDVGYYGNYRDNSRTLEPGMVFAIEPLLYVGANLVEAFKQNMIRTFRIPVKEVESFIKKIMPVFNKYVNIAARVEDDILITAEGNKNLSSALPKTVSDIEKTMSESSFLNQ